MHGLDPCLVVALRDTSPNADDIAEALLEPALNPARKIKEYIYNSNLFVLADAFYIAVKNNNVRMAKRIFHYGWENKADTDKMQVRTTRNIS